MTDAPDLEPLPENIEGVVIRERTSSHELHHRIPWGQVAIGLGLVALAYVVHQYLGGGDESDERPASGGAEAGPMEEAARVAVEGGAGLMDS